MARQPTLAEILADDTGRIRPEVADLLMEPLPARPRAPVQPRPPRRPEQRGPGNGCLVIFLIVLILISALAFLPKQNSKGQNSEDLRPLASEASISPSETVESINPVVVKPEEHTKKARQGRVIGGNVNIREEPGLQGNIIKMAHEGETLAVLSFARGWYQIRLEDQRSAYIFGAYLMPLDFESHPYRVAATKDGNKILIKEEGHPIYYQVILPDRQNEWIKKEDVDLIEQN